MKFVLLVSLSVSMGAGAVELSRRHFLIGAGTVASGVASPAAKALAAFCPPDISGRVEELRQIWHWRYTFTSPFGSKFQRWMVVDSPLDGAPALTPNADWFNYFYQTVFFEGPRDFEKLWQQEEAKLVHHLAHTECKLAHQFGLPIEHVSEEVNHLIMTHFNQMDASTLSARKFAALGEKFTSALISELEAEYPLLGQFTRRSLAFAANPGFVRRSFERVELEPPGTESVSEPEVQSLEFKPPDMSAVRARIVGLIRNKPNECEETLDQTPKF